jgi:intracellular multiplication protein IcmK
MQGSLKKVICLWLLAAFFPLFAEPQDDTYQKLQALILKAERDKVPAVSSETPVSSMDSNAEADTLSAPPKVPSLRDEAFKQLLDRISPLTPEQIIKVRKQQDQNEQAAATLPNTPPRPVSSTLTIDLSPGVTPPVIRLAAGFVTSVVFVDSTGQPWPIADYNLGSPKHFNIQWDRKTNTLFVQGTTTYSNGNLAVRLATLETPIMLSLVSGQREVDYRVDLQVRGRGPNALPAIMDDGLPPNANPTLLSVLDGVPPPGSTEMSVSDYAGRAWLLKDKRLVFRTQLTVLSPAWTAMVSSQDGTKVYEMAETPMILATQNGKTIKVLIKDLKDSND